jgi:hypothetical protein
MTVLQHFRDPTFAVPRDPVLDGTRVLANQFRDCANGTPLPQVPQRLQSRPILVVFLGLVQLLQRVSVFLPLGLYTTGHLILH